MFKEEKVQADEIFGHGGLFKTKGVGQGILAAAMDAPVSVMETAGEGGAWGIAVLAAYMRNKKDGEDLARYLNESVFAGNKGSKMEPVAEDVAGFDAFIAQLSHRICVAFALHRQRGKKGMVRYVRRIEKRGI